jgi:hypothetical protein
MSNTNETTNKSLNEIVCYKEIEKSSFDKFSAHHKSAELVECFFYNSIYIIPLCFNVYTLFINIEIYQFIISFLVTLVAEGFLFINAHLYVHESMLIEYQHRTITTNPWGYYHHYVNSMLYSQIPFGYRLSAEKGFFLVDLCSYLFNVDKYVYTMINGILVIEYISHEYMHSTRKAHYTSFNPASSKFILIHYIMKGLQSLSLIDPVTHLKEHHREKAENMHLTADWLDFKLPIIHHIQDIIATTEFKYFKDILKVLNGTSEAVFVDNKMTNKANIEEFVVTMWFIIKVSFIIYLLSMLQFYNSNSININLFIYTSVLRFVYYTFTILQRKYN